MRLGHPVPASASPGDHIMRRYVCGLVLLLLGTTTAPSAGYAQAEVPPRDRVRLAEAMRYSVFAGGKRFRAMFCAWGFRAVVSSSYGARWPAAATWRQKSCAALDSRE